MVDSKQKGSRAELVARDLLRQHTGLQWERTPGSGALGAQHKLKGDLYIPDSSNYFVVEVKHYADDHLTSKALTDKTPQIVEWWEQASRQGVQVSKEPLLLFKFDRSKWFVAMNAMQPCCTDRSFVYTYTNKDGASISIKIAKLEDWLANTNIRWI